MTHQLAQQIVKGQIALFHFLLKITSGLLKFPLNNFKFQQENKNLNLMHVLLSETFS